MFEYRLGLALSRSRAEVRALPYPEYKDWKLMYAIEPWGWENQEYQTAALRSMLYNIFAGSTDKTTPESFMRDRQSGVVDHLMQLAEITRFDEMPQEERNAIILQKAKQFFGRFE